MADFTNNIIKCSNTDYVINVSIYPDPNMKRADNAVETVVLDGYAIEEISYTSSLNQLVMTGYVVCIDKYGKLDSLLEDQQCRCDLLLSEIKKKTDNGQVHDDSLNKDRCLEMSFVVNSMRILERRSTFIKYKIDLVSINWYSCIANVQYSNNDKDPEPILDIIKTCLQTQNLAIDDYTFGKVKSNVKMNYISKLNDNLFTVVPYLMHKLFFLPDRDDTMKFIVYDWFNQKYRLLDLTIKDTFLNITNTTLSFFKSNAELMIQQYASDLGSFDTTSGNISEYKNLFAKDMYTYDIENNTFKNINVEPKQVVQYMNNNASFDKYVPKYHEADTLRTLKYMQSSSYWNASLNVYNDSVQSFIENGAITIRVTGDIRRQCGELLNICLDRSMNALTGDSKTELENMKKKYKLFEGPWVVSSVTSVFQPSNLTFKQKLALCRNFTFDMQKPKQQAK